MFFLLDGHDDLDQLSSPITIRLLRTLLSTPVTRKCSITHALLGTLTLLIVIASLPATAKSITSEYQLDNGLKLIVREDHRAPIVISQVWYKVGSTYEGPGSTGLSHVLEHMLFKGTHRVPTGDFSRLVAEYGGDENAFTSKDYTGYYQKWDVSRLPISFELEADRMINATFPADEFAKEMQVIMEERRLRTDDNPGAKAWERFAATAYASSSYGVPIIGWMHDLKTITRQQTIDWYKTWYAPNNAVLVVVGDVNSQEVYELAKTYFGPLKTKPIPLMPLAREVEPLGERRLTIKLPAKLPNLFMAYNVPTIATVNPGDEWEVYALRMAAGILASGNSSRLSAKLQRGREIAASASAGYTSFSRGDDLFTLTGIPNQQYSMSDLEAALLDEIELLKTSLATPTELNRVRAQIISGLVYQQDSISSQASTIGRLESIGLSWKLIDGFADELAKVTPEQIRDAVKKYLVTDRSTVAYLEPQL